MFVSSNHVYFSSWFCKALILAMMFVIAFINNFVSFFIILKKIVDEVILIKKYIDVSLERSSRFHTYNFDFREHRKIHHFLRPKFETFVTILRCVTLTHVF